MKTTLMLVVVLLASFSPLSAQVELDTMRIWRYLGSQGGVADSIYTGEIEGISTEGTHSRTFKATLSAGATAFFWRKLDHPYPRPAAIAYDMMLSFVDPNDQRVSSYWIVVYLHYSSDTISVISKNGGTGAVSQWAHIQFPVSQNGPLSDSVDGLIIGLTFGEPINCRFEAILDNFRFIYLIQGPPVVRYRYEVVDRFGDPDPKPAMLSVLHSVDFGKVPANAISYKDTALIFRNLGDSTLKGTISIKSDNFFIGDPALVIPPRDSVSKTIWLNTSIIGKANGFLVIQSNNSTSPDSVSLSGLVIGALPTAQPSKVVMGNTPIGITRHDTIYIENNGNIPLSIDSVRSTNPKFVVTPTKDSIAAGGKRMFIISFSSNSLGAIVDTILFFNNSITSPVRVILTGMVVMGVEKLEISPLEFSLSQNYPNPFNPRTTIEFSLPKRAFVNLTIYNTLGQVVKTLVSSEMESGTHRIIWKANNIPSGIYFYRLNAGNFVETKKMILMK